MALLTIAVAALSLAQNTATAPIQKPAPNTDSKMVVPAPPARPGAPTRPGKPTDPGMVKPVPPAPQDPQTPGLRPA